MKAVKFTIQALLLFILIFSVIGPSFAELNVEFNSTTAHVGDTVTITVSASNDALVDWYPVIVAAPIPDGLKYLSHVVPDKQRQDYDLLTGLWDVNRMRHDERGHLKVLIITTEVLPEAAGKTIHARAWFERLVIEPTGTDITADQPQARADTLRISSESGNIDHGNGNGTGNGTGSGNGNGTGNRNGNGNDLTNSLGNSKLANAISNLTQSKKNDPLANLQTGGGGGKSYEVTNATNQNPQVPTNTLYAILGILIIIVLILLGYFKGYFNEMRKN